MAGAAGSTMGIRDRVKGPLGCRFLTSPPMGSEMFSLKLRPDHSAGRRQEWRGGVPGPLFSLHQELTLHLASWGRGCHH